MINQFLSNLSFSPAVIEEIVSHIKNMDREKHLRLLGLIFLTLNFLVILLAAVLPYEVTPQNIIPTGGFSLWFYRLINSLPEITSGVSLAWTLAAAITSSYFYLRSLLFAKELSTLKRLFLNNKLDQTR